MPLRFLTAGESHGPAVSAILDGMPAGLPLTADDINRDLSRRQKGYGSGGRMKIERDRVQLLGGWLAGQTTGAPLGMQVTNLDHVKWQGKAIEPMTAPRPGHADLTGALKYGYRDLRYSLERASARETTMRVAVGAVCRRLLAEFGVTIGSYVVTIGSVTVDLRALSLEERIALSDGSDVRCPDPQASEAMRKEIRDIMTARDTLGGIFEVVALGVPPGLGSHVQFDRKLDGRLAGAMVSIHAMKGVEIGNAFENATRRGTQVHDEIFLEEGLLTRHTNRAGGLEGGITTGQPIIVRVAMKPISTTLTPLDTVDLKTGKPAPTQYERSDFCSVPRAGVIGEAMMAWVLADALLEKLGGDSLAEMKASFENLRRATPADLPMDGEPIVFWP